MKTLLLSTKNITIICLINYHLLPLVNFHFFFLNFHFELKGRPQRATESAKPDPQRQGSFSSTYK